jgi:4-carboxymuconolactone decarboxylase
MNDVERFRRGLAIRKAVLGHDHVERSMAQADEFSRPMQELVTEYCWGEVWGREGLPHKTRSLLNLAMLSILNRPEELKLHVRGAIRNGATREEIQEVFMQVAIYAGVPAGLDAVRVAKDVFRTMDMQLQQAQQQQQQNPQGPRQYDQDQQQQQ